MLKAIIADDETLIKKSLKLIVERTNLFEVLEAFSNGRDALAYLQEHTVDLLITDIRMPVMDGLNLISALREAGNETDVIILTGYGEFEYAQKAIRYGVSDYLLKPIVPEQLQQMLEKIALKQNQQKVVQELRQESLWYCRQMGERLSQLLRDMDGLSIITLLDEVYSFMHQAYGEHLPIFQSFYSDLLALAYNELMIISPDLKEVITAPSSLLEVDSMENLRGRVRKQISEWMLRMADVRSHGIAHTMKKALTFIQQHIYDENLTLQSVADELNLSISYTSESIKQSVGMNFTSYVTKLRMEKAKALLADSNCKMYEAAFQCGYVDYAHFTKTFKKYYGYSPKEYRARLNVSDFDE
ncbi:response regulator [Paenibacillus qinlingensis]|uniref:Two-component system response regulator YesN n=1 Tax=Paenibacillus qinlingensis TaxID=1837343 RepID=A0ABU1NMY8_9BACL|nr:response regulator [Paenibacillus qinlingensis]MDR6548843.1 two-component system response regulator YesN [Paenibacillus qinlingensis]